MTQAATPGIAERLSQLRAEIDDIASSCGRQGSDVSLVAVSKTRSLDAVSEAIAAGQHDFGENTVQDAMTKIPHTDHDSACWHFIGHLQSNKCKQVAGNFSWLHSVDSLKLLQKLNTHLLDTNSSMDCLLQVNLSGEGSKSGITGDEAKKLIVDTQEAGLERIRLRGLMTIGVAGQPDATRKVFSQCRELAETLRQSSGLDQFDQLSMGMSGDYREAIVEGSTMLRIGTAIFGARSYA